MVARLPKRLENELWQEITQFEQEKQQDIIEVLEVRFENVPTELVEAISSIEDPSLLKTLHRQVITVSSLAEFEGLLQQLCPQTPAQED